MITMSLFWKLLAKQVHLIRKSQSQMFITHAFCMWAGYALHKLQFDVQTIKWLSFVRCIGNQYGAIHRATQWMRDLKLNIQKLLAIEFSYKMWHSLMFTFANMLIPSTIKPNDAVCLHSWKCPQFGTHPTPPKNVLRGWWAWDRSFQSTRWFL